MAPDKDEEAELGLMFGSALPDSADCTGTSWYKPHHLAMKDTNVKHKCSV